jgi:hypothetical protein
MVNMYCILYSVEQLIFFWQEVDIFEKCVEQLQFKQVGFEQLTSSLIVVQKKKKKEDFN